MELVDPKLRTQIVPDANVAGRAGAFAHLRELIAKAEAWEAEQKLSGPRTKSEAA